MLPRPDWMDMCWNCGESGHEEKDYPEMARKIREGWRKYEEERKRREDYRDGAR